MKLIYINFSHIEKRKRNNESSININEYAKSVVPGFFQSILGDEKQFTFFLILVTNASGNSQDIPKANENNEL